MLLIKKKLNCILLIDDDEPTNYLNKLIIEDANCTHRVSVALGAREGLDYLTGQGKFAGPPGAWPKPDLIFLDINMPAMDGWEFLEQYQQLPESKKARIVVVMLTTSFRPEDEIKAMESGYVSRFRNKPLTTAMLMEVLQEHFPENLEES